MGLANELVREKIRASEARENIEVAHSEITKLRTVLEFQETQFTKEKRELREEIVQTRIEKEKAVLLAQPTVQTPTITPPAGGVIVGVCTVGWARRTAFSFSIRVWTISSRSSRFSFVNWVSWNSRT